MKPPGRTLAVAMKPIESLKGKLAGIKIEHERIVIHSPTSEASYHVTGDFSHLRQVAQGPHVRFELPSLVRMEANENGYIPVPRACVKTNSGFLLDLNELKASDKYRLTFTFKIEEPAFLDGLVRRDHALDPDTSGPFDEYWMSAQLRDVKALNYKYGPIDLRDLDFHVNVAIQQDIKDVVPKSFVRQMEIVAKLINETDRQKKMKLAMEHLHTREGGATGKEGEILAAIQDIFIPSEFRRFVEVRDRFVYSDVRRGVDVYKRLPFPTFPKTMTVITRTDLTAENPAADGRMLYRRQDLRDTLEKMFPKAMQRLD